MSDPAQPPSYDDVLKASAPPPDGGMGMAPYPTQQPAPYPSQPPTAYPAQPPAAYPAHPPAPYPGQPPPQQGYGAPTYPPQNYGAAPTSGYPQTQPQMPQVQQTTAPGQYNYSTVTVVSPQGTVTTAPVVYGAPTSQQLLAHQRSRRRLCIVTAFIFVGIIGFGIIMMIIMSSTA